MSSLIAPTINLALLIGILVYYTRSPLRQYVRSRHDSIREDLQKTAQTMTAAKQRHQEFSAKLSSMDAEAAALHKQALEDAQAAGARVAETARRLSVAIVSDAKTSGEAMFADFRRQLRTEFAEKVIQRAEQLLTTRLTGEDRARMREEFARQLGGGR